MVHKTFQQGLPQFHEISLRQGERIIAVHIGSSSCLGSLVAFCFKGACRRPLVNRKKLEKLFEYESKQGAVIWAEDLMLLDAYDLNHDAGACMSLRPSADRHRNSRRSERHKDVWGFCKTSDFMTLPQIKKKQGTNTSKYFSSMKLAQFPTRHETLDPSEHVMDYRHALFNDCSLPKYKHRTPLS